MEKRIVEYDGRYLEYYLFRKKMKNMRMRIKEDGKLFVSCPVYTPLYEINAFILRHFDWIEQKKNEIQSRPLPIKRNYISGEEFLFLGQKYTLVIDIGAKEKITLIDKYMVLSTRHPDDIDKKHKLIDKWYKERIDFVFRRQFDMIVKTYRHLFPKTYILKIRQMKARWGSCMINKNTVVLNSKLIYADIKFVDYVIMHELCHFYHKNHDYDFYRMLASLCPCHRQLKKELNHGGYISYSH